MAFHWWCRARVIFCVMTLTIVAAAGVADHAQEPKTPLQFGGSYSALDPRRQALVDNWVSRFNEVTGQKAEPGPFYDTFIGLSTKTTFEAVTHALEMTQLTDQSGARLGDALDLVERVDSVRGRVEGASGDHQFRMYIVLTRGAVDTLVKSQEFKRGTDNTVYHKGYPISYRGQGGAPSIQVSISVDGRNADIDVDYRSSSFPAAIFNGHLTAANSDVRAGDNYDRHNNRWVGFQNWWRSLFGIRVGGGGDEAAQEGAPVLMKPPRVGKKTIDVMVRDFLNAWLVEGDIVAAMGYVSERSYACLAVDSDDPLAFDRGVAPFMLMTRLKAAHDALGKRQSLEGLTVGVRLSRPGLKLVTQPYHAQFVIYAVPDDVAAAFDCQSRLTLGDPKKARRAYGNYFGTTFYINGQKDLAIAILWANERGYWKIVSWQTDVEEKDTPLPTTPAVTAARVKADASLVEAARDFLESWLIRKRYDQAFRYVSSKSYACYDLFRSPDQPPATSLADAGQQIRAGLERSGNRAGDVRSLEALIAAVEPVHPAVRLMDHPYSRTFALVSYPNAFAERADCAARARGERFAGDMPPEYGTAFGMYIRFLTQGGEGPALRLLWLKEAGEWRIAAYEIELP